MKNLLKITVLSTIPLLSFFKANTQYTTRDIEVLLGICLMPIRRLLSVNDCGLQIVDCGFRMGKGVIYMTPA